MNNYRNIVFLTLVLASNIVFGQSEVDYFDVSRILKIKSSPTYIDDYCHSYKFIPLETSDDCLVGHPVQVDFDDNRIFIRDLSRRIFIFNREGEYLSKINSIGKGPGEYVDTELGFSLFRDLKRICLFDKSLSKILLFDTSGNFIIEEKIDFRVQATSMLEPNIFLLFTDANFTNGNENVLTYFDIEKMEVIRTVGIGSKQQIRGAPMYMNPGFDSNGKEAILKLPFCDTVLSINIESVRPKYIFDLDNKGIPHEKFTNIETLRRERELHWHILS